MRNTITAMYFPDKMTARQFLIELESMARTEFDTFGENMDNLLGKDTGQYPEDWMATFTAWVELNQ